jgi:hypothetical protein
MRKIGSVSNPLTIIAIFAGFTEISGTAVLQFIAPANQAIYVWFLTVFPILLVALFFITLNFNHKVLYAPSDYQDEENFLRSLPKATFAEKVQKIEAEIQEQLTAVQELPKTEKTFADNLTPSTPTVSDTRLSRRSTTSTYLGVEDLVFRKLGKEFSSQIQREIKLNNHAGLYIFDGLVRHQGVTTVIEVKYLRNALASGTSLRLALDLIQKSVMLLPAEKAMNMRILLAIVTDEGGVSNLRIAEEVDRLRNEFSFLIEIRFFNRADLEQEFNIGT